MSKTGKKYVYLTAAKFEEVFGTQIPEANRDALISKLTTDEVDGGVKILEIAATVQTKAQAPVKTRFSIVSERRLGPRPKKAEETATETSGDTAGTVSEGSESAAEAPAKPVRKRSA